jgi:hypothetical protein
MTPEDKEQIKSELRHELKDSSEAIKESIAASKREICDELDRGALKKEIIDQVLTKKRSRWSVNWQHPAILLLLGFAFTTACGAALTSCWKTREWENEQSYLRAQTNCERERVTRLEEVKQKYEVKDEIIRRVAETNTAAEEILNYFLMDTARRDQEKSDRITYWKDASRNWRINEKILKQRLLLRFTDTNVSQLFQEIVTYRNLVGVNINNRQEELSSGQPICMQIVHKANECMAHVTEILTPQVIKRMNEEILSDERALRATTCTSASPENNPSPSPTAAAAQGSQSNSAKLNPCEELYGVAEMCNTPKKAKPN